ncbi:toprim domain-containing protein [Hymenobacter sp. HDW8]|uniref:toprim domain-containing protein n=1 Tax=Hymenobacter sp. HDW8 TaxID=2714932 RepID=UPI001409349B|nr:toprim domain-containing protein [Hymenobacter sp. HDW8]QIL78407.1 toprim domain-containing protein [Hymenobacter sp. HDW8]
MEHDLTFQQIKERVELPELLTHYGYKLQKGEDLAKGRWHVFEGDDKLVVFKGRGGDWMYFNSQDDRDKGTVVDWMKNRVSTGRVVGIEQLPGRNLWQSVNDYFRVYLNLPEAERPKLTLPPISETAPGEKFQSIFTKDCRPLENTAYLEGRGITKTTLENPLFAGRILNQFHTVQRGEMPPITYVNTAFPAYHEGRVVGLELKGEGFKGQAAESQFARSLWLSKLPEGKPPTHLVVSESAIDTLSFAQMHPGERALYASTSGTLTQNKIFELKRLMGEERIPAIKSAFDNDTQGHHFDTRLLAGFASEQNPMKVVREHEHLLTIEINTTNLPSVQAVSQQLKTFNAKITEQYHRESGEPISPAIPQTLRDELISSARQGPNTYQFHVPMNREALSSFNQAIGQHLQYDQKIELVKSQGKDWNEDLKQDQMQKVVKREIGSIDEAQKIDTGKTTQQRQPHAEQVLAPPVVAPLKQEQQKPEPHVQEVRRRGPKL